MLESLRADQLQRWRKGQRFRVEDYLAADPSLRQRQDAVLDLIQGEMLLRQQAGEPSSLDDWLARFPEHAADLRRQFYPHPPRTASPDDPLSTAVSGPIHASVDAPPHPPTVPHEHPCAHASPAKEASASRDAADAHATIASGKGLDNLGGGPRVETMLGHQRVDTIGGDLPSSSSSTMFAGPARWPTIPGYELLEELGRGGMGIVYRARQLTADRIVALKIVRGDVLDTLPSGTRANTLERFRHEARLAASLEHENLVTVYEVGEANGLQYYAMRYVRGQSLAELLQSGPLENRRAATYLEPVARAVQVAHDNGILHRDIKPHNILIDRRTNRPLIADFGLAKFTQGDDRLTRAGDVMGTPAYMAPEQATDATHVTASADVYSLGATLYDAITARPPFQAAGVAETIRQLLQNEPLPPRQLNPAIDRDLETICLKCLQKEVSRRYATAGELADDLRRYLNGEPIRARPIGPAGRAWRWCRRNPVLASLVTIAATCGLLAISGIVIGAWNTSVALVDEGAAKDQMMTFVDELFTRVSEEELLNAPGLQPLRKDLLSRALVHYQTLLDRPRRNYMLVWRTSKPGIREEIASSRFRVALITHELGSRDEALAQLLEARRQQEQLVAESPDSTRRLRALGDTLNELGRLYQERDDELPLAVKTYEEAVRVRREIVQREPADRELRRKLANTLMGLGILWYRATPPLFVESRQAMTQAREIREELLRDTDTRDSNDVRELQFKLRRDLAMGHFNLAQLARAVDDSAEMESELLAARDRFAELLADQPGVLANSYRLVLCLRLLGDLCSDADRSEEAVGYYEQARASLELLVARNPDVVHYQTELARMYFNLAVLARDQGDDVAARANCEKAEARWRELERQKLGVDELDLALVLIERARLDPVAPRESPEARERLREARERLARTPLSPERIEELLSAPPAP